MLQLNLGQFCVNLSNIENTVRVFCKLDLEIALLDRIGKNQ